MPNPSLSYFFPDRTSNVTFCNMYIPIRLNGPIIMFVFDIKRLMADISLKGAKFSKINTK